MIVEYSVDQVTSPDDIKAGNIRGNCAYRPVLGTPRRVP